MENLIWKPVVGYEGLYEVSNTGLIKSLNCYNLKTPHLLSLCFNANGYLKVGLSKNNKTKQMLVHRIVAEAFIPNPDNLEMVNHRDEDKTNNNVNNLEWCTRAYNQLYSIGLHPERKQLFADNFKQSSSWTKKGIAHKNTQKVAIVNEQDDILVIYENASVAGKELNIYPGNITAVCKKNADPNRNKIRKRQKCKAGGYIFKFAEE